MNFSEFIVFLKEKENCSSIAELYKVLGGKNKLNMEIRNFQLLASGALKPQISSFISISNQMRDEDLKQCFLSFLLSHTDKKSSAFQFIDTTSKESKPSSTKFSNSIISSEDIAYYTLDQIKYLISNPRAIRIQIKVLLEDQIDLEILKENDKIIVNKLIELGLFKKNKNIISFNSKYTKLHNFSTSSPDEARESNNLIFETIKVFLSQEEDTNQTLHYTCLNLSKENAKLIHSELTKIKELCFSLAEEPSHEKTVPFIMVNAAKTLSNKDLR